MKKSLKLTTTLLIAILFSNCATILGGESSNIKKQNPYRESNKEMSG